MPDDLHRAVQAELDAHEPGPAPSFDSILDRKRARDRRRGGAALAATALAVAGVAFVPSALTGSAGSPERVAQDAGSAERFSYHVRATDSRAFLADSAAQPALNRCLELPGLSEGVVLFSYPGQYTGIVTGRGQADALKDCVGAVPGMGLTLTARTAATGPRDYVLRPAVEQARNEAVQARVAACVRLPGVTGGTAQESSPPTWSATADGPEPAARFEDCMRQEELYRTELSGSPEAGDLTLAQMQALRDKISTAQDGLEARGVVLAAWGPDASRRLVSVAVEGDLAEATRVLREVYGTDVYVTVGRRPQDEAGGPKPSASAPPAQSGLAWTGVQVCRIEPARSCADLGADAAQELDALLALDATKPADAGVVYDCVVEPHDYQVQFRHPSARTVPVVVPDACEPMRFPARPGEVFEVAQAARDAVRLAHFGGTTAGSHGDLTVGQQRFVEKCLGGNLAAAADAPGLVGKRPSRILLDTSVRTVGRDGDCLARNDGRQEDRINLVVEDDEITWAGRF